MSRRRSSMSWRSALRSARWSSSRRSASSCSAGATPSRRARSCWISAATAGSPASCSSRPASCASCPRGDVRAQRGDGLARLGLRRAQGVQLGAQRARRLGAADGVLAQLVGERAQGVEPHARLLPLALQLLEPAAVVAGQRLALVALDRRLADALAQPLGLALHRVDALDRGRQLGARRLQLAVVVALDAVERGAQLAARGLGLVALPVEPRQGGLEVGLARRVVAGALAAQSLELGREAGADRLGGPAAGGLELGEPALQLAPRGRSLGERGGQLRLGRGVRLDALGLEPLQALDERGAAGGVALLARVLEPLQPREQLDPLRLAPAR